MQSNVVSEMYLKKGKVKSMIQVVDPRPVLSPGIVLVPKSIVIGASISMVFILVVFVASVVTASAFPRPGLLDENCQGRSCLSSTGLKCINSTCQCLSNQYYATRCIDKKAYQDKCSRTTPCKDNTNLACKNGICQCELTSAYWNGSACALKGTFKLACKNDTQCLSTVLLICDNKTKTCLCNSNR